MDPFSSAPRATCTAAVAMLAWVGRRLCVGLVGHCWAAFATERWNRCGSDRGGQIYKNRGFHSPGAEASSKRTKFASLRCILPILLANFLSAYTNAADLIASGTFTRSRAGDAARFGDFG